MTTTRLLLAVMLARQAMNAEWLDKSAESASILVMLTSSRKHAVVTLDSGLLIKFAVLFHPMDLPSTARPAFQLLKIIS